MRQFFEKGFGLFGPEGRLVVIVSTLENLQGVDLPLTNEEVASES
tara:strand:+ start:66 stop:200 length:135 start_codon:yes stop_codon:yes gene_type:complete